RRARALHPFPTRRSSDLTARDRRWGVSCDRVMIDVHPSAHVSPRAELADGVVVGPLAVVGDEVVVGAGTRLFASCVVLGPTRLGDRKSTRLNSSHVSISY